MVNCLISNTVDLFAPVLSVARVSSLSYADSTLYNIQYTRMTVIFSDFDAYSPLINCVVTHRKLKSHDQNFLWVKMQFFYGEIPTKSNNITVILIKSKCSLDLPIT